MGNFHTHARVVGAILNRLLLIYELKVEKKIFFPSRLGIISHSQNSALYSCQNYYSTHNDTHIAFHGFSKEFRGNENEILWVHD